MVDCEAHALIIGYEAVVPFDACQAGFEVIFIGYIDDALEGSPAGSFGFCDAGDLADPDEGFGAEIKVDLKLHALIQGVEAGLLDLSPGKGKSQHLDGVFGPLELRGGSPVVEQGGRTADVVLDEASEL